MKNLARYIFINISRCIMVFFYKKEYLRGRWFDNSTKGWRWCWRNFFMQKIIGYNKHIPWTVSHRNIVGNSSNISFHVDDLNNFQNFGCYFQNYGGHIFIGKGTYIAPNVGIITQNHDIKNLDNHVKGKDIRIGNSCWVGMNAVILPGVILGDNTVVGAGAVVTKSFEDGNCVIAGNPAKIIRKTNF